MLDLLRKAWERNPDQRLGQLVSNAARDPDHINPFGVPAYRDPFGVEDDQVWAGLERMTADPPDTM